MIGGGLKGAKGGRWHAPHKKKAALETVRNDINVTPLVDIILVLLTIFMVVTPMMQRGHDVELPKTKNHFKESAKSTPVVAMDAGGDLWFEKENLGPVGPESITAALERVRRALDLAAESCDQAADPECASPKLYLKATPDSPFGKLRPLLMAANDAGLAIGLASNELKE
ncbi:MAG: biopolymer transporter ExbD [Kofleriaceae bacterium]